MFYLVLSALFFCMSTLLPLFVPSSVVSLSLSVAVSPPPYFFAHLILFSLFVFSFFVHLLSPPLLLNTQQAAQRRVPQDRH